MIFILIYIFFIYNVGVRVLPAPRDMPRRSVLLKKVKFFLVLLFEFKILLALWTLLEISSPQTDIFAEKFNYFFISFA